MNYDIFLHRKCFIYFLAVPSNLSTFFLFIKVMHKEFPGLNKSKTEDGIRDDRQYLWYTLH